MALVEALFAASFADAKCTIQADHAALLQHLRSARMGSTHGFHGDSYIAMAVVDTVWSVLLQHVQRARPQSGREEANIEAVRTMSVRST